jgi:hypothetical protein
MQRIPDSPNLRTAWFVVTDVVLLIILGGLVLLTGNSAWWAIYGFSVGLAALVFFWLKPLSMRSRE